MNSRIYVSILSTYLLSRLESSIILFQSTCLLRMMINEPQCKILYVPVCLPGENALHMAIVIEDPSMVKFLLDKGANYHERCFGNFFCPDDQKDSRTDCTEHEWVDVCERTNYEG